MLEKIIEAAGLALTLVVLSILIILACEKERSISATRMNTFFAQEKRLKEHIMEISNNDR